MAVDIGFQLETDLRSLARSVDKVVRQWQEDTGLVIRTIHRNPPYRSEEWKEDYSPPETSTIEHMIGGYRYLMSCCEQGESNG